MGLINKRVRLKLVTNGHGVQMITPCQVFWIHYAVLKKLSVILMYCLFIHDKPFWQVVIPVCSRARYSLI